MKRFQRNRKHVFWIPLICLIVFCYVKIGWNLQSQSVVNTKPNKLKSLAPSRKEAEKKKILCNYVKKDVRNHKIRHKNSCIFHHKQDPLHINNTYFHFLSTYSVAINITQTKQKHQDQQSNIHNGEIDQTQYLFLLYPEWISFNSIIISTQNTNPALFEHYFDSECSIIEYDYKSDQVTHEYKGIIKQTTFGTICHFEDSLLRVVFGHIVIGEYYFHLKKLPYLNHIFKLYCKPPQETRHPGYHEISIGIESPIIYDTRYGPIPIYGYLNHIQYHIKIGVTAYYIFDIYGELFEDITSYWDPEVIATILDDSDGDKRIDIFVYDLAAMIKLKVGAEYNDNRGLQLHFRANTDKNGKLLYDVLDYHEMIYQIMYLDSRMETKWLLMMNFDEYILMTKGTVSLLPVLEDIAEGPDMIAHDIFDVKVMLYDHEDCYQDSQKITDNMMRENFVNSMVFRYDMMESKLKRNIVVGSKLDIDKGYHKRLQNEEEELLMVNVGKVHIAHFKGFWWDTACKYVWNEENVLSINNDRNNTVCFERHIFGEYVFNIPIQLHCRI